MSWLSDRFYWFSPDTAQEVLLKTFNDKNKSAEWWDMVRERNGVPNNN